MHLFSIQILLFGHSKLNLQPKLGGLHWPLTHTLLPVHDAPHFPQFCVVSRGVPAGQEAHFSAKH
jgi:hypothetical protein